MSLIWERTYSADLQPGLLDDDEQNLWTRPFEHNSQYSPPDDALLSPPPAEADPLENLPSHGSNLNRGWEMGEHLLVSLGDLELNGNDGLSNSGIFENTFGRISNNGTDADSSRNVPETINPMLSSEFANSPLHRAYTIRTPVQTPNAAVPSSPWQRSNHRSGECSANLQPHIYIPHRLSAATHTQYSDSAWETVPPTPSADDSDPRPVPDGSSASMQSYNNSQTGIWPPGNTYRRDSAYSSRMGMRHGNGTNSIVKHLTPQSFQELFANADAATPFHTEAHIVLDNPTISVNTLPPAMSVDPPTSAVSALASASTSETAVSGCPYRGCQAKFTGGTIEDSLRRHKLHYHGNKPKPMCPVCQLVIQSGRRDNLKRHITNKHPGHPLLASLNVRRRKAGVKTAVPVKRAKEKKARQSAHH